MGNQTSFKNGHKGGPGRPKGSLNRNGLGICYESILKVVNSVENQKLLQEQVNEQWKENPLRFYHKFIMPLQPRNTTIEAPEILEALAKITLKPLTNENNNKK